MPEAVIEVEQVSHAFGDRTALDGVSLTVSRGEIVALLGPNGGGKTTLFRILCSLLVPHRGRVRVCGFDPAHDALPLRRAIGVVFQSPSLDPKLTVAENLKHHGHLYGLRGDVLRARARALLAGLDMEDRAGDRVETLSGGLARRAEIAKCMLPEPAVLLLDEPSTGLDPAVRRDVWNQLDQLRQERGVTALLTTHFMEESERCDRVAVLDRGKLVACATPDELKAQVGGDVITVTGGDPERLARQINEQTQLPAAVVDGAVRIETPDGAQQVPKLAAALGETVQSITLGRPTLEDVFVHLTGHRFD